MPILRLVCFLCFLTAFVSANAQENELNFLNSIRHKYKQRYALYVKVFARDKFHSKPYALQGATVVMMCKQDTTKNVVVTSDAEGFASGSLNLEKALKDTTVILKVTYVGMEPWHRVVKPKPKNNELFGKIYDVNLDSIILDSKPITLEETVIMGQLQKMYLKGDTTVFNVDAYKMPEGSVLLELVRRLPGLRYQDNQLTYFGHSIEEMRLNGDTFFKHDISIALKNMPTAELKTVEIYNAADSTANSKKLVMDMKTKHPMPQVQFANIKAGIANKDRDYLLESDASMYKKNGPQISLRANLHTTPEPYSIAKSNNGKDLSATYTQQLGRLQVDASYNNFYAKTTTQNDTHSKTFVTDNTMENLQRQLNFNKNNRNMAELQLGADFKHGWRAEFKTHMENGHQVIRSLSSDSAYVNGVLTHTDNYQTMGHGNSNAINAHLDVHKDMGRHNRIGVQADADYNKHTGENLEQRYTNYVQFADSIEQYNRRVSTPSNTSNVKFGPFYRYNPANMVLEIKYLASLTHDTSHNRYTEILDGGMEQALDSLSNTWRSNTVQHLLSAQFMYLRHKQELTLYAQLMPTSTKVTYSRPDGLYASNRVNMLLFNVRASSRWQLKGANYIALSYNARKSMPSDRFLLNVSDYSDPLNISSGNQHLKGSVSHEFSANATIASKLSLALNFTPVVNAITSRNSYDLKTGVHRFGYDNVNGNYNFSSSMSYNTSLKSVMLGALADYSYNHSIIYSVGSTASEVRSHVNYSTVGASLNQSYGCSWLLQGLSFKYQYSQAASPLNSSTRRINYSTKLNTTFVLPKHIELTSDLTWYSRHGSYVKASMRDQFYWDLKCSVSTLRSKRLKLSVEAHDVLHQQRSYTQQFMGNRWWESRQQGVTAFILFSAAYRFSRF